MPTVATGAGTYVYSINSQASHGTAAISNGSFTYTPNTGFSGSDSFTYMVTDAASQTVTGTYDLTVTAPPSVPTMSSQESDQLVAQGSVNMQLPTVTNANGAPVTYALTGGLPTGLSFDTTTGIISGTTTNAGTFNLSYTATDSGGTSTAQAFTLSVFPTPNPLVLSEYAHEVTQDDGGYQRQIAFPTVSGGTAPYIYSFLDSNGNVMSGRYSVITGTGRNQTFTQHTVQATGSTGIPQVGQYTTYNTAVSSITVTTDAAHFTSNGSAERDALTYMVQDANGQIATDTFQIGYQETLLTLSENHRAINVVPSNTDNTFTISLPTITDVAGYTYTCTLLNASGVALYNDIGNHQSMPLSTLYTLSNGNKVEFSSSSQLTYTQVGGNSHSEYFTYRVRDNLGQIATDTFAITLPPAAIVPVPIIPQQVFNTTLAQGSINIALPTVSNANGAPVTYALAGTLPTGLSFDTTTGIISGTTTDAGAFPLSYTATDTGGTSTANTFTLTVAPTLALTSLTYTDGTLISYAQTPGANTLPMPTVATGGGSYVFSLPSAQTTNSGTITTDGSSFTYTPSVGFHGTDSFNYTVTDAADQIVTGTYDLAVAPPANLAGSNLTLTEADFGNFTNLGNSGTLSTLTVYLTSSNETISGNITGNINLDVQGSNNKLLTLSGTNTYTGTTTVESGAILAVPSDSALGANTSSSALTLSGGTLQANASFSTSKPITLTANSTINPNGNTITLTGAITPNGHTLMIMTASGGSVVYNGYTLSGTVSASTLAALSTPFALSNQTGTTVTNGVEFTLPTISGTTPTISGLPSGTSFSSGTVMGTPSTIGSYAIDYAIGGGGLGISASGAFTLTITYPPLILSSGNLNFTTPYDTELTTGALPIAIGGSGTGYTYTYTEPAHGTLTINGATFAYNPNRGTHTTDSFTYTVTDSTSTSTNETINIAVLPLSDLAGTSLTLEEADFGNFTDVTNTHQDVSTLTVNLTTSDEELTGNLSENINLEKTGPNKLALAGNNTNTGPISVSEGILELANENAASGSNGSAPTINLAAETTLASTVAATFSNPINFTNAAVGIQATQDTVFSGTLTGGTSGELTVSGGAKATFSGTQSGAFTTKVTGTGTTLSIASERNVGTGGLTVGVGSILKVTSTTRMEKPVYFG